LRPVADDVVADDTHVFEVIARERGHGTHVDERTRKGATLELQLRVARGETPILLDADLHAHHARRSRASGAKHFLAAHHHLDGPPSLARERKRERFEEYDGLATKPPADFGGRHAQTRDVETEQGGAHGPHHVVPLRTAPNIR